MSILAVLSHDSETIYLSSYLDIEETVTERGTYLYTTSEDSYESSIKYPINVNDILHESFYHFKGTSYEVTGVAISASNNIPNVGILYRSRGSSIRWFRECRDFFSVITREGKSLPRFSLINAGQ